MTIRMAVTGAWGWLGSHLLPALERAGATPLPLTGEVRDPATYGVGSFAMLVHLAAALPAVMQRDGAAARAVNVDGTRAALAACAARGAGLVFASTAGVYDPRARGRLDESAPIAPPTPYGESKRAAELLCLDWSRRTGLPVTILRFFNLYGPGQSPEQLPGYLVQQVRRGEPILLRHPESRRDFLHVEDAVAALVVAAERSQSGGHCYNVGSGMAVAVGELAHLAAQGRVPVVAEDPGLAETAPWSCADCGAIRRDLGWQPAIDLEQGLADWIKRMDEVHRGWGDRAESVGRCGMVWDTVSADRRTR
ncbi:MAG: NAD(P)-dependent oxidoreductase [Magnetococcales bacterium]|nr:NAD(P)-dependent oxidoreductase [Magnetococcales bacterium]